MFGDFLNEEKHKLIDFDDVIDLDNGTPVVARYNYREFQFGIYGNGCVIYQDCWITKRMEIVFSLEKSSITDFAKVLQFMNTLQILNMTRKRHSTLQKRI